MAPVMARPFLVVHAQVPPYLHLANVQFDIDAEKFYKLYIGLMTHPLNPERAAHP